MEEVKSPRSKLDIEVNVDTDEAQERIERLTRAAKDCAKSLEELSNAMIELGKTISTPKWYLNGTPVDTLYKSREQKINEWMNGSGPLPVKND